MDRCRPSAGGRRFAVITASVAVLLCTSVNPAAAQPAQPAQKRAPTAPATPTTAVPAAAPASGTPASAGAPELSPNAANEVMAPVPGGVTADQVGVRAMQTSYQAKAAEENANAASARADQAWAGFLPYIQATGRYTRLSPLTNPDLSGGGSSLATTAPGGTCIGNCPPGFTGPVDTNAPIIATPPFSFPVILNQYLAQATLTVPISDYFLKINKQYSSALRQEEAARYDTVTARAKSYSDGKLAYFSWVRARGDVVVSEQNLAVARAHLKDAENQFAVGNASKADVLRAQTQVASAELVSERAKSNVVITERQLRVATHAKEDETFLPGESLDNTPPPVTGDMKSLVSEALQQRPELKSLEKNAEASRKLADASRARRYPSLSGFGDVTYANPNQRKFPISETWFPTWSVGAQVTWSPNDIIAGGAGAADAEARASAIEAQKIATRDGIELEVTQAYQGVLEADISVSTTTRQLDSAVEGYRVARELFNNGRGTGTTLIDAEQALAQARFAHVNARVDARSARVRLDHALGRDTRVSSGPSASPTVSQ